MRQFAQTIPAQIILGLLFCLLSGLTHAQTHGYASGFSSLYRVDLTTGAAERIGSIGFNDVEGLAMAPDGTLYGVADQTIQNGSVGTDFLFRIDTQTGQGTLIGQLGNLWELGTGANKDLDYGLSFSCDGRLWLSSATTQQLWEVDPSSAATRLVGNMNHTVSGLGSRDTGLLGVSVRDAPGLVTINPDTAASQMLQAWSLDVPVSDAGVDFAADGRLFALADPEPLVIAGTRLLNIDPKTGDILSSVPVLPTDGGLEGLAISPVARCATGGSNNAMNPKLIDASSSFSLMALLALLLLAGFVGVRRVS